MAVIILFMFALYISRYHSVRNTHFPCIFLWKFKLTIALKNPPKVCTRSFNFNLKNAKAPSSGPSQTLPPARALRALACVFPKILQIILPPHEKNPAYGLAWYHRCNHHPKTSVGLDCFLYGLDLRGSGMSGAYEG